MSRQKKGKEVGIVKSVRIQPAIFDKIIKVYGSLTAFIDFKIKHDRKLK